MQIYLHIILPQLRLLVERLRLTFTFSQFSLEASILYWMYWVPLWKVEMISVFLQKEPKHWNQLEATEYTQHPNIMMLHFSKKKHPLFLFFVSKKKWGVLFVVSTFPTEADDTGFHPQNRNGWKHRGLDLSLPHRVHVPWWTLQGVVRSKSSRWFQRNHGSSQVESHIGSLAAKSHVLLNSRWISQ